MADSTDNRETGIDLSGDPVEYVRIFGGDLDFMLEQRRREAMTPFEIDREEEYDQILSRLRGNSEE